MKAFLRNITRITLLVLLLPAAALLRAENPDSPAISKLLDEVKLHAAQADDDSAILATFYRSKLHWTTHAAQLESIKAHVNNLVRDAAQMSELRHEGSPWQQQAIDRTSPLLPEIASHLSATIKHLNENLNRTQMQPYRELVMNNQKLIHTAHEMIDDIVDYGQTKTKVEALEKQLDLAPSENPAT